MKQSRRYRIAMIMAVALCVVRFVSPLGASEREHFLRDLTRTILSSDGPIALEHGWRGVLLVPPGTSLSAFVTNYESLGSRLSNNTQILADSYLFDRPLLVREGVGFAKARRLSEVWEQVLRQSVPRAGMSVGEFIEQDPNSAKWLFQIPDKVERVRGTAPVREPSEYYLRYRQYRSLYRLILTGESGGASDSDSWRLHPLLAKYGSAEQAKVEIEADWKQFGYRDEVELAINAFNQRTGAEVWSNWTRAEEAMDSNLVLFDRSLRIPRTSLSPPPSEWLRMGGWQRSQATTEQDGAPINFEFARVQVLREWFRVDDLLRGDIRIDDAKSSEVTVLSDGRAPTLTAYPEGPLSVYVEELILCRNIRYEPVLALSGHPLAAFASPAELQVIGYVVRALPSQHSSEVEEAVRP